MTVLESPAGLSFDRTVSRRLVRRTSPEEVFLTDFRTLYDGRLLAGARLPRAHQYYNDHLDQPRRHDPLTVLEAVRQAVLAAARLHPDAPADCRALPLGQRLRITDPGVLCCAEDRYDLELRGTTLRTWSRGGVLYRLVHQVDLWLGGVELGQVETDTAVRSPAAYQRLRMLARDTPPPGSDELLDRDRLSPLPPGLLGRQRPENVLLLEPAFAGEALTARLRLPVSHVSLFDQPQDHLPGPVLLEAARQAGLLLLGERSGRSAAGPVLVELAAEQRRFVELDREVTVTAEPAGPGRVRVRLRQDGTVAAEVRLGLAGTERGSR